MLDNNEILDKIYDYSLDIYDALIKEKLDVNKLYKIIKENNIKELNKIKRISAKEKKKKIIEYDKKGFLDQILNLIDNKYTHLKGIKDIVNIDNLLEFVFNDEIFINKVKVIYTNKIIDLILDKYYDYDDIKLLSKIKEEILNIERNTNSLILKRINEYYIKKITV